MYHGHITLAAKPNPDDVRRRYCPKCDDFVEPRVDNDSFDDHFGGATCWTVTDDCYICGETLLPACDGPELDDYYRECTEWAHALDQHGHALFFAVKYNTPFIDEKKAKWEKYHSEFNAWYEAKQRDARGE